MALTSRPAHLAGAMAGLNGLIAGAEALQIRRRNSLRPSAIRCVKGFAMDRSNIRDCVFPRCGRSLFCRLFGAAHKGARRQQSDQGEFSQCLHSLDFFSWGPVVSAGSVCRQFQVCSLERPSPIPSQTWAGFLQVSGGHGSGAAGLAGHAATITRGEMRI